MLKFILSIAIIFFSFSLESALPEKKFRIFIVAWHGKTDLGAGFTTYLRNKNIPFEMEIKDCKGDFSLCHKMVQDIRRYKPDLIFTWGGPAAEAIAGKKNASPKDYIFDIPILAMVLSDPVESGIIHTLDKPGRNVTGVGHIPPMTVQLNAILMYKKNTQRILALYNDLDPMSKYQATRFKKVAMQKDIEVILFPLSFSKNQPNSQDVDKFINYSAARKIDFIYIPADCFISLHSEKIVAAAHKAKIPTFCATESVYWYSQPLLSVISHFSDIGYYAGKKAYEILIEKKDPGSLPYETFSHFSIVISKKAFKQLDFPPPISLLNVSTIVD